MTAPAELTELVARLAEVAGTLQAGQAGDDPAGRARAAAELEQLGAAVGQGKLAAPAGLELGLLTEGLRLLADWLRAPTADNEAQARQAMAELQATVGPLIGWDPARDDAARRAQYRQEARAALDRIFTRPAKP